MLKQGAFLSILNLVSRACNFLLFWLITNKFGATKNTDWFFFVYGAIFFIITIFIKAVENILVPLLNQQGLPTAFSLLKLITRLSCWSFGIIFLFTSVFGLVIAPKLFGIPLPDNLGTLLLICTVLSLQPSFALLTSFLSSYLQATQRYTLPTIQLTFRTLGIILLILLPWCKSILCLGLAFLLGELTRFFVLRHKTLKEIKSYANHEARIQRSFFPFLRHIGWLSLALASSQINPIIDLAMVGGLGRGSITLVDYAAKLRGFPILALNGLLMVLLGEWSKQHLKDKQPVVSIQIFKVTILVTSLTAAITFILAVTIDSWLQLIFISKKFSIQNLQTIRNLLLAYFPGVPLLSGSFVMTKALLVYQKSQIIAFVAAMNIVFNVLLNLYFIHNLGITGVAISTSFLDLMTCIFLCVFILRVTSENEEKYNS